MNPLFWQRLHGGSTHLPIVLLLASVFFDLGAWRSRDDSLRHGLRVAGLVTAIIGVLGGFGAVISGLAMTRGQMLGNGFEKLHHLFVWPAFAVAVVSIAWRILKRDRLAPSHFRLYLAAVSIASVLTLGAGFWGGEMLLTTETTAPATTPTTTTPTTTTPTTTTPTTTTPTTTTPTTILDQTAVATGHQLFLRNCAHCHGETGRGDGPDEGADIRNLRKSDARIASVIQNGVKGEMPKFRTKFTDTEIHQLTAYIRTLH